MFLSYPEEGPPRQSCLSYRGLYGRAAAIAAELQAIAAPQERALILCSPGLDYIAAFFACQLAGLVAVPAYPPRNARHVPRVERILEDAGTGLILTTSEHVERLDAWLRSRELALNTVIVDDVGTTAASGWPRSEVGTDAISFLQYTSGTTDQPKGVVLQHRQVLDNLNRIVARFQLNQTAISVVWLPPYHDMGLIGGILAPLSAGFPVVLMAPEAFVQRPRRWLEAISTHRGTITAAPNFAYQLCADQIDTGELENVDLSCLKHALVGAEPVRERSLRAFADRFADCNFDYRRFAPVYGLAESTLLASGGTSPTAASSPPDRPASMTAGMHRNGTADDNATPVPEIPNAPISCGRAVEGHDIRIVDPTTRLLRSEGEDGEIWISGPSVAAGYWEKPRDTAAVFEARRADDSRGQLYLRTGDIGRMQDGELFITGRIKEMIIRRGRNYAPQDIEATVEASHGDLAAGQTIVFEAPVSGAEGVVVVHELSRSSQRRLDAGSVFDAVRRDVAATHDIEVDAIMLVRPASLPRTTSGKLQRGTGRDQFLASSLATVAKWSKAQCDGAPPGSIEASRREADRLIAWLRDFSETRWDRHAVDRAGTVPNELVEELGRVGLFGMEIPAAFGGLQLRVVDKLRVTEQLAAIDHGLMVLAAAAPGLAVRPILDAARPSLRQDVLPRLASGRSLACFAMTEPEAPGSNPRAIRTVAIPD
ncbi:MAG: AMP-binding protein, partial [Pseudomonadota bacterium]